MGLGFRVFERSLKGGGGGRGVSGGGGEGNEGARRQDTSGVGAPDAVAECLFSHSWLKHV